VNLPLQQHACAAEGMCVCVQIISHVPRPGGIFISHGPDAFAPKVEIPLQDNPLMTILDPLLSCKTARSWADFSKF
jgi:hypothetical protein